MMAKKPSPAQSKRSAIPLTPLHSSFTPAINSHICLQVAFDYLLAPAIYLSTPTPTKMSCASSPSRTSFGEQTLYAANNNFVLPSDGMF